MELFFSPMSCSLAVKICLNEAGIEAEYHNVSIREGGKPLADGSAYEDVNPKGQVPALRLDDGQMITEMAAVLQYIADHAPAANLAGAVSSPERLAVQQWIHYIATEIHRGSYYLVFNPLSPPQAQDFGKSQLPKKYDYVSTRLDGRDFLVGEQFTVADAYLATTLNWAGFCEVDLSPWPTLQRYHQAILQRPSVQRAMAEDMAMLKG